MNNAIKLFFCMTVASGILVAVLIIVSCFVDATTFDLIKKIIVGSMGSLMCGVIGLGGCAIYEECNRADGECGCCFGTEQSTPLMAPLSNPNPNPNFNFNSNTGPMAIVTIDTENTENTQSNYIPGNIPPHIVLSTPSDPSTPSAPSLSSPSSPPSISSIPSADNTSSSSAQKNTFCCVS